MKEILLPGSNNQLEFLESKIKVEGFNVLIIGPGTAPIADYLKSMNNNVQIIVSNYDSLIDTRLALEDTSISVKIMDYEHTDFPDDSFDLIYAQASVSSVNRNKIVKEIKRILKQGAYFCAGEMVKLNPDVPKFVSDIMERSVLSPLYIADSEKYYTERNFEVVSAEDQSKSLRKFYRLINEKLQNTKTGEESGPLKKALNLYSHEVNAYLKLGADKYIGYKTILLIKR